MLTLALLGLIGTPTPVPWTFEGRQVERRSTSRTDLLVEFTLDADEDPLAAVKGCVQASQAEYQRVTYIYCAAYSPEAYQVLSGKLRLCYSVNLHWFAADAASPEMLRLYLAGDDPRYPNKCPVPVLPFKS
ncbi:hypothetical protein [Deinococcus sp.]|uniref:hypothetical protein n=1 Tax=Deinococcus sp. TaxID=47478 RepID=UPI003B5CE859